MFGNDVDVVDIVVRVVLVKFFIVLNIFGGIKEYIRILRFFFRFVVVL